MENNHKEKTAQEVQVQEQSKIKYYAFFLSLISFILSLISLIYKLLSS